jgi:hypothetical protein
MRGWGFEFQAVSVLHDVDSLHHTLIGRINGKSVYGLNFWVCVMNNRWKLLCAH